MADILNIGIRSMLAYQAALAHTSNNIGNVKTPFYSRREILFAEDMFGNGVNIADVRRVYDESTSRYLMKSNSNLNMNASYYDQIAELESLLDNETSEENKSTIGSFIKDALKALRDLNTDVSSVQSRAAYLNRLNFMANRFNTISSEIDQKNRIINQSIDATTKQVNNITQRLADINKQIANANGQDISALLDLRESNLQELSTYIDFTTLTDDHGNLNVMLNNGMSLVFGDKSYNLSTQSDPATPDKLIVLLDNGMTTSNITSTIKGGQIAGLYKSQNLLSQTQNSLGRLSLAITSSMNQQNKLGIDYNGALGGNVFNDMNRHEAALNRVLSYSGNLGSEDISVNITDVSQLKATDYKLVFDTPTHFTLTRLSDNSVVSSGSVSSLPQSISVDGMSINVDSGMIAAGDQFTISPNRGASQAMKVTMTDPKLLALGWPVKADYDANNRGAGSIKVDSIIDTANPMFSVPGQLNPPMTIEFISDTTYQIIDANTNTVIEGPINYNPASGGDVFPTPGSYDPGFRISLSGSVKAGDKFSIGYNNNAIGDNRNGNVLEDLYKKGVIDGGSLSFSRGYGVLSNDVSIQVNDAKNSTKSSQAIYDKALGQFSQVSGVIMQEELSNIAIYQECYMASAQILQVAKSIFDTIVGLGR